MIRVSQVQGHHHESAEPNLDRYIQMLTGGYDGSGQSAAAGLRTSSDANFQ